MAAAVRRGPPMTWGAPVPDQGCSAVAIGLVERHAVPTRTYRLMRSSIQPISTRFSVTTSPLLTDAKRWPAARSCRPAGPRAARLRRRDTRLAKKFEEIHGRAGTPPASAKVRGSNSRGGQAHRRHSSRRAALPGCQQRPRGSMGIDGARLDPCQQCRVGTVEDGFHDSLAQQIDRLFSLARA